MTQNPDFSVARSDLGRLPPHRTRWGLRWIWLLMLVATAASGCGGCGGGGENGDPQPPVAPKLTPAEAKNAVEAIRKLGCDASNTGNQLEVKVGEKHLAEFDDTKLSEIPQYAKLFDTVLLELQDSKVTAAGLQHVGKMTNVVSLDLTSLSLTNDSIKDLVPLKGKLESLRLENTGIDDSGLAHLKGFTKLKRLYLRGNKGITDEGVAKLELPESTTVRIDPAPEPATTVDPEPAPNAEADPEKKAEADPDAGELEAVGSSKGS